MIAVGVVDRAWRLRSQLNGWWRVTGVTRSEWERGRVQTWTHPDDWPVLTEMAIAAQHASVTRRIRIGPFGAWVECTVEIGPWTADGAPIVVRSIPPLERCAIAVTDATRYLHVNHEAEEILGRTAWQMEGASWRDRMHTLDLSANDHIISNAYDGTGGCAALPVLVRYDDGWKLIKVWSEPGPHGTCVTWFCDLPVNRLLGRPLPSMVSVGMVRPRVDEDSSTYPDRSES